MEARAEATQIISPESSPTTHQEIRSPTSHRINFIQGLPLLIGDAQGLSCLDSPLHVAGPHFEGADALRLNEVGQSISILGSGCGAQVMRGGEKERDKRTQSSHENKLRSVTNGRMVMNKQEYRI